MFDQQKNTLRHGISHIAPANRPVDAGKNKERKASLKSAALSLSSAIVTSWGKSFLNTFVNCGMSYDSNLLLIISKYFLGRVIECYFEVICLQI